MERKTVGRALIAALLLFQCVHADSDLSGTGLNESMLWEDTPGLRMEITSRATSMTEGSLASGITVLIVLISAASALKIKSLEKRVRGRAA